MPHVETSPGIFDCSVCHTRCDGASKGKYIFENDTAFSEKYENEIIAKINSSGRFTAAKCKQAGYPDIAVSNPAGKIVSYIEIKVQRRTFMSVKKIIPKSNLSPSETVALNLSDLLRYFEIQKDTTIPTSIVWVLLNRPCITNRAEYSYYFQTIDVLERIYNAKRDERRFRRKSGEGDVVDGIHKGVTVNYHFSLNELRPWHG
jgi:hypothetical protein